MINPQNRIIKENMLIRSNCPNQLDKTDLEYLKSLGLKDIIDLREIDEYNKKISSFENNDNFNLYHITIYGGKEIPKSSQDVPFSYLRMIDENKENYLKIFKILLQNNGGTLYFCSVGKDRTGVLTALILLILGMDKKQIVQDYMITKKCQEKVLNDYILKKQDESLREIIIPHEEFIIKFIELLEEKYGSVEGYLLDIGLNKKEITQIRNKLLI